MKKSEQPKELKGDDTTARKPDLEIGLYSEAELDTLIECAGAASNNDFSSNDEGKWLTALKKAKNNFIGPRRTVLFGTPGRVAQLHRLADESPSFAAVVDLYRREALASIQTASPMRPLPIILLGPPGVGKTFFAARLAEALGTPFVPVAMNLIDDIGEVVGHSLSWRAARMGIVARTLLDGIAASPLIYIDEIEKAPKFSRDDRPSDIWHSLFERENSKAFKDAFLGLKMRADHVLWLASANSLDPLPKTVIDRTLVLHISEPAPGQRQKLAASIFKKFASERAGLKPKLSADALSLIATQTPRGMIKVLTLALGYAAARGSSALERTDIEAAQRLTASASESRRSRIGFI